MSELLPKEIIALARKENWTKVRNFLKHFIDLTLKSGLPYDVTLINDIDNKNSEESVIDYEIIHKKDIANLNQIKEFDTLSIYQFNQHYQNNLYLRQHEGAIIFFAKYMSPITDELDLNCFEFIILMDSTSNPVFLSNSGDTVNYKRILEIFESFELGNELKSVEKVEEDKLEAFIFEHITGKNALWGGSETKAFQEWKKNIAELYHSETGNYSYYSGSLTKKYHKFLEKMFTYWKNLTKNGERELDTQDLEVFLKFLK
ncbi:MAG: hypothetical protein EU547_04135 [Promethearchaeota archaeon]|nr:MAG: hypothetical protein EU547_04135 [Candidatus Lokiarchaeota archaeon]